MPSTNQSGAPVSGLEEPTFEQRIQSGEITPFPDDWCSSQLLGLTSGRMRKLIYERLNDGWALTLYKYRAWSGPLILVILRLDPPSDGPGSKLILPLTVERMCGIVPKVRFKSLAPLRPLYALPDIAARANAPILMVEGEKAAEAAKAIFPNHVVSTCSGGAQGIATTDLRHLGGRHVVIWPDNDPTGRQFARNLAAALVSAGAVSVRIVQVPNEFPNKWDLADPYPVSSHG